MFPNKVPKATVNASATNTKCVDSRKNNNISMKINRLVFYLLIFNGLRGRLKTTHELVTMFPYNTKSSFNTDRLTKLLNRQSMKRSNRSSLRMLTLYFIYLGTYCYPNVSFETQLCEVPNEQYIMFLNAFDMWKSRRLHLLDESKAYIQKLNKTHQRFLIARSIMSVFDIMESIGQLLIGPGYKFGCSLCNVALTVAETMLDKKFLIDMVANINDERALFNCLVQKLPQSLKCKIENEISHQSVEEEVISQLQEYSLELSDDVVCFVLFSLITGMTFNLPRNKITKSVLKASLQNAVASFLTKRLISQEYPLDLDAHKIVRKKKFDVPQHFLSQAPVLVRIIFNVLNIYESSFHLYQEEDSPYSIPLIHFKNVMDQQSEVIASIEEVKPSDFSI
ncbi:uncharacterized protein [Parasteatoda tepidariorum]|uniref:uncharacterized protein n=1 Tax=Parasteatoda tepidariorum TaxID=114398 RepID=UPI001C71E514|nr:uncharacterized protein LOC107440755 [Parasteatoda tepidariorum]